MPSVIPRLPACQFCAQKKVKCDNSRPQCALCAKQGKPCLIYDSSNRQWLDRAEIHQLEIKEEALQPSARTNETAGAPQASSSGLSWTAPSQTSRTTPGNNESPTAESLATASSISRGGGLGFISTLFSDADWRRSNADLLRSLAEAPRRPADKPIEEACPLPPTPELRDLFDRYLNWSHVQNPFLLRSEIWSLYRRLHGENGCSPLEAPPSHKFRAYMICAIASVIPYRNGMYHQHPASFYQGALQCIGRDFLTRGLNSIQDLLLICRFGIYHHIGTSIWDMVRVCSGLCVEQGLHLDGQDTNPQLSLLEAQHRRRIFWQVYIIDRYSSTTLDRPFAISDADIQVDMPVEVSDDDLVTADQTQPGTRLDALTQGSRHGVHIPTEMTVFFVCVHLRKISSRIHAAFARLRQDQDHALSSHPYLAPGRVLTTTNLLIRDLEEWRRNCPVLHSPRCLYDTQEWYDLLHARETLSLIRRAVDIVPKKAGSPPRRLSSMLFKAAVRVIQQYAELSGQRTLISHTRSYFHLMFTAGLSIMFCISVLPGLGGEEELRECSNSLLLCETTLLAMAKDLSDAHTYVTVFEALRRHASRKIQRNLASAAATRPSSPSQDMAAVSSSARGTQFPASSAMQDPAGTGDNPNAGLNAVPMDMGYPFHGPFPVTIDSMQQEAGVNFDHTEEEMTGYNNLDPVNDDLLDWAFLNYGSMWNMDAPLGEYDVGDPSSSALFYGMNF